MFVSSFSNTFSSNRWVWSQVVVVAVYLSEHLEVFSMQQKEKQPITVQMILLTNPKGEYC